MELSSLCVVHTSKAKAKHGSNSSFSEILSFFAGTFQVETCQRSFFVFPKQWLSEDGPRLKKIIDCGADVFCGLDAYRFLLRVATGLESEIKGETDIFGQVKEAWQRYERSFGECVQPLSHWIQKLFEDTKEIRSRYLRNVGGASYGSLVRRILRHQSSVMAPISGISEPVLIIGAGQIARSIAPWLVENELWLWNRSAESMKGLAEDLASRPGARFKIISGQEDEARAWRRASHVVICIPIDPQGDARRIELWRQGAALRDSGQQRSVIHLGAVREQCGAWADLPSFYALNYLFELQKRQEDASSTLFAHALRACDDKARLRALGGPITLPHGWEDLAAFA